MHGQNNVYHGHFEAIRHGAAPGKDGFTESLPVESTSPHKWLVLSARYQSKEGGIADVNS
jgi:hypothetical protein